MAFVMSFINNALRKFSEGVSVAASAVSARASGALSLATSTISTVKKAKHIPAYYKQVLALIQILKHNELSAVFHDFREQILTKIQSGHLKLNGESFKLNAEFVSFFNPQNLSQSTQIEPIEIVRIKNILDFLLKLEELFFEIENLPMQDLDPERFMHRLKMLGPIAGSFRSIKNKSHIIFENLLQLNTEMEFLFTSDNGLITELVRKALNIFSVVHYSITAKMLDLENLSTSISSESQELQKMVSEVDFASEIGRFLGAGVHMMDPHNATRSPFWSQAISKVPLALTTLTEKIAWFSENFEGYENTKSSAALLKTGIDRVLKDLEYFHTSNMIFAIKLIPILNNLNEMFDVYKLFVQNLGNVNDHLQDLVKDKLRLLKFDVMLNIGIFIDELEIELMLQPGQLSEKFLVKVESSYSSLIDILSNYVEFDDIEDEDILRFYDAKWAHQRLEASYSRKAKHCLFIQQYTIKQQYLGTLQTINNLSSFKLIFAFLAPYVEQISPEVYNDILATLRVGNIPTLSEELIANITLLFNQYFQSSSFIESRLNQSHIYLDDLQTKMALFLELAEEPNQLQLKRRLGVSPALIRLNEQFYFYDGSNPKKPLKILPEFSLQLEAMPKNVLRYLDTHELDGLLLTVGHTLSRPMALKSLQMVQDPTRYINESKILNLDDESLTQVVDIESLTSDSLLKLLEAYKSFLLKRDGIEQSLNLFFNNIKEIYCGSSDSILDVDRKNALALSLTKIGVYLEALELKALSDILGRYTTINIQLLKTWALTHHLPVLKRISLIKKEYLERYDVLSQIYNQKMIEDNAQKFVKLEVLPRAEYFLSSNVKSSYLRSLEQNLRKLMVGFSPKFQEFLVLQSHEGFEGLLEFDKYLEQPQQVLLFKWLLNTVVASRQLFERMESLKRSDFSNGFSELSDKVELVQVFFNAWQYLYQGTSLAYHQNIFLNFGQSTSNLALGLFNKFDYFQIQNDTIEQLSSIEQVIHWFLNGSEILEHLVSSTEDSEVLKSRLEVNSVHTIQKIRVIVAGSNSYLKLIANTFMIYNVLTAFKTQLAELPKTVYDLNYKNLLHLRATFFADIIQAVEKLELDLGLQPTYLSEPLCKILDVIFEHYLIAINPDVAVFCKVMLDDSLENKRLAYYETEIANSRIHQTHIKADYDVFSPFIDTFESNETLFRTLSDLSAEMLDFKKIFKERIAPKLVQVEFQHLLKRQITPELRTSDVIFWDERFNRWIAEAGITLDITGCINFIRNCKSFLQGQLDTERLKQQLLIDKHDGLNAVKAEKILSRNDKLTKYLETYYDQYVAQFIKQNCSKLKYLGPDCQSDMKSNFKLVRIENLESLAPKLVEECQKPFQVNLESSVSDGVVYQAIGELCNTKLTEIKHTGLEKYYVLDRVLESVALFMTYIQFVEATLDFSGTDNFEDRNTLATKKEMLNQLKEIISNSNISIDTRLTQAQGIIQTPSFKDKMLGRYHSNGNWLQQFLLACYQGFLEFLAYVKLYDLQYAKTKQYVRNMQQISTVTQQSYVILSKQHFFSDLNAPVQASLGLASPSL